jgi:putative phosphoribosyl transferase
MPGLERPSRQPGHSPEDAPGRLGSFLTGRPSVRFPNRAEAGRYLARLLADYRGRHDAIVLALPRGGVPIGYEIARQLGLPLDVLVVRKLGIPQQPELGIGAIASGGVRVLNRQTIDALAIPPRIIETVAANELRELERRERAYRGDRSPLDVKDRTVILADDGLATGATMRAAIRAVKARGAREVVVTVPVGTPEACLDMEQEADLVLCATTPEPFYAVGLWYEDFSQLTDDDVRDLLDKANRAAPTVQQC